MAEIMLGKLGRQLAIQFLEHRQNMQQGNLYISILAQTLDRLEQSHHPSDVEEHHVAYWETTISQPNFATSPILSSLTSKEVNK
jgi:hypothetical protein